LLDSEGLCNQWMETIDVEMYVFNIQVVLVLLRLKEGKMKGKDKSRK